MKVSIRALKPFCWTRATLPAAVAPSAPGAAGHIDMGGPEMAHAMKPRQEFPATVENVPAWQAKFPARGRITSPCAAVRHSPALFAPTNHEERWGDHSFALDSVMLSGGARGVFRASSTWRTGCFPLVSPCVAPALGFSPCPPRVGC